MTRGKGTVSSSEGPAAVPLPPSRCAGAVPAWTTSSYRIEADHGCVLRVREKPESKLGNAIRVASLVSKTTSARREINENRQKLGVIGDHKKPVRRGVGIPCASHKALCRKALPRPDHPVTIQFVALSPWVPTRDAVKFRAGRVPGARSGSGYPPIL
jgi:hypothetical protein